MVACTQTHTDACMHTPFLAGFNDKLSCNYYDYINLRWYLVILRICCVFPHLDRAPSFWLDHSETKLQKLKQQVELRFAILPSSRRENGAMKFKKSSTTRTSRVSVICSILRWTIDTFFRRSSFCKSHLPEVESANPTYCLPLSTACFLFPQHLVSPQVLRKHGIA